MNVTQLAQPASRQYALLAASPVFGPARRVATYATVALVAAALVLVAVATVPVLFGYHTYIVNGSSMEPTLSDGSVVVTHPTSTRALGPGDIVAYQASPDSPPVLHRIISASDTEGERAFITQGDNNATADPRPITLAGSGDRMVYAVPYAGYVLNFAKSGPGRLLLVGGPLLGLAFAYLRDRRRDAAAAHALAPKRAPAVDLAYLPPPAPVEEPAEPSAGIIEEPANEEAATVIELPSGLESDAASDDDEIAYDEAAVEEPPRASEPTPPAAEAELPDFLREQVERWRRPEPVAEQAPPRRAAA